MKVVVIIVSLLVSIPNAVRGQALQKIDSLKRVLNTLEKSDDSVYVDVLNTLGFEFWTIDPAKSEQFGKDAASLAKKLNYQRGLAMAHRVIGVSYWSRGDFLNALKNLFESQTHYKEANDLLGEANASMNIGMVYADQKDYGRALENYQYANQLFKDLGRTDRIGTTFDKIGTVYLEKGDFDKAFDYLHRALEIHQGGNFQFGIMEASNRLGLLYRERGEYDVALEYLRRSRILAVTGSDNEHIVKNNENMASVFIRKGMIDSAHFYLDAAYPIAMKGQYHKWLRDILKDYRDIYVFKKDYRKAFYYGEQYEQLKDSLFSEEKQSQIANLQFEHQKTQQQQALKLHQQQITFLQQEKRLEKFLIVALIFGMVVLIAGGLLLFRNQRIRFRQKQERTEREKALGAVQLENARLRETELRQSIEYKNKELTSYTINFIQKNELIESIRLELERLKSIVPNSAELNTSFSLIRRNASVDSDWENFKRTFENVHHNFFGKLLQTYPDLTPAELRLCALVFLNLSIKEMASLMGISADSVKTARYRLRKKFNLSQDQNLTDFIITFG